MNRLQKRPVHFRFSTIAHRHTTMSHVDRPRRKSQDGLHPICRSILPLAVKQTTNWKAIVAIYFYDNSNYSFGKYNRETKMEFTDRMRTLMQKKGLTQKQLATITEITEPSLSKYLSGERTPRVDVIVKLANALETTVDYLLGNDMPSHRRTLAELKTALAREKERLSDDEKKELIKLLLEF
ncbi:MAG: helix-turn-helix transcriptional regulator [Bacilli bacterium]|nr:helix-turn-helix transcriptional regulator [Bacilli bacterium]